MPTRRPTYSACKAVDNQPDPVEAGLLRFPPIMMTTVAAIMGTLPIALGNGAGSDARRPLGIAIVGGLLLSQLLTLYITPVIYLFLEWAQGLLKSKKPASAPGV